MLVRHLKIKGAIMLYYSVPIWRKLSRSPRLNWRKFWYETVWSFLRSFVPRALLLWSENSLIKSGLVLTFWHKKNISKEILQSRGLLQSIPSQNQLRRWKGLWVAQTLIFFPMVSVIPAVMEYARATTKGYFWIQVTLFGICLGIKSCRILRKFNQL